MDLRKIKPKDLRIVWGKNERYWKLPPPDKDDSVDENCFAEMSQVSWLEVTAQTPDLKPGKRYSVGFCISFNKDTMSGWEQPVYVMAKVGKAGRYKWKKLDINMSVRGEEAPFNIPKQGQELIIKVPSTGDNTLHFGLYDVWGRNKWKAGLRIHYAFAKEIEDCN